MTEAVRAPSGGHVLATLPALPLETLENVASYLSVPDVEALSATCHALRRACLRSMFGDFRLGSNVSTFDWSQFHKRTRQYYITHGHFSKSVALPKPLLGTMPPHLLDHVERHSDAISRISVDVCEQVDVNQAGRGQPVFRHWLIDFIAGTKGTRVTALDFNLNLGPNPALGNSAVAPDLLLLGQSIPDTITTLRLRGEIRHAVQLLAPALGEHLQHLLVESTSADNDLAWLERISLSSLSGLSLTTTYPGPLPAFAGHLEVLQSSTHLQSVALERLFGWEALAAVLWHLPPSIRFIRYSPWQPADLLQGGQGAFLQAAAPSLPNLKVFQILAECREAHRFDSVPVDLFRSRVAEWSSTPVTHITIHFSIERSHTTAMRQQWSFQRLQDYADVLLDAINDKRFASLQQVEFVVQEEHARNRPLYLKCMLHALDYFEARLALDNAQLYVVLG